MSAFLRQVFSTMVGVAMLGLLLLFVLVGALPEAESYGVEDGSVLVLDLGLPVMDNPRPAGLDALFGQSSPVDATPLHRMLRGIRLAADDSRIVGLYLTGSVGNTGWANLRELRAALVDFAATGKPIMSYFPYYDERALYLSSVGENAYTTPFGDVDLSGFSAEINYYGEAFRRYGVEVQVTRVGKYKSAVEPYLLDKMSDENRDQLQTLLGDLFEGCLQSIADSRSIEVSDLQAVVAGRGVLTSEEAMELGLIQGARYEEEVAAELRVWADEVDDWDQPGRYDFTQIWLEDYLLVEYEDDDRVEGATIAVIYAEGDIVDGMSDGEVGGESLAYALEQVRMDEGIAAVVLRVDSPGGSASASEVILHQVEMLAAAKPLVVSMGSLAASGGYWISSLADEIYAEPNTITGSIGVFGMYPNVAALAKEKGVAVETVKLGPHANMFSMFESKSPESLARLQISVDQIYDGFLERVARGRKLEVEAVHEIAQGRVWSGKRALELGLVDKLGGLNDALERAASLAGLTEGYATEHWTHEASAWEEFVAELVQEAPNDLVSAPDEWTKMLNELQRLTARRGIYVRLPWDLQIH